MTVDSSSFRQRVYEVVGSIPDGRVMTYGDIAVIAGQPYAARAVGQIAHFGHEGLPWHRVVNHKGGMASGFWGGKEVHQRLLEYEDIVIANYQITDFKERRWSPDVSSL